MFENVSKLMNITNLIDIMTVIGAIASVFVVVGLVFKYIHYRRKKKAAKKEIIKYLERFISTEEDNISKIDCRHQEKIAEVGNDFKQILKDIDKNKILFPKNILEESLSFRDNVRDLSEIRLVPSKARGLNQDFENIQIQNREKRGNELVEEAREFIKKIE